MTEGIKVVARNRRAAHDYNLLDRYEAGLVLMGSEVKSILSSHVNIQEAFVQERGGELWLLNMHVREYEQSGKYGHEPLRPRKLLLHRKEIVKILSDMARKGYTVVPTQVYFRNRKAKVEIAMAQGKKLHDKRQSIKDREDKRQIDRTLKTTRQR